MILRVLKAFARKGFMFADADEKTRELIGQLSGTDLKYGWQPLGPELIPFDEWAVEKLKLKKVRSKKQVKTTSDTQLVLAGKQ
jgi:hypothetical protein